MAQTTMIMNAKMKAHDEPTAWEVVCANLRKSSLISILLRCLEDCELARVALREHYALGSFVKFSQQPLDQSRLYPACFFWMDQVTNNSAEPGVCVDAEKHGGILTPLQLIDRRL